jgi:hypothetical protein
MPGLDIDESRLAQKVAVLLIAQEFGAQKRHDYGVEQAKRPATVGFRN